jgi:hypothetical protein
MVLAVTKSKVSRCPLRARVRDQAADGLGLGSRPLNLIRNLVLIWTEGPSSSCYEMTEEP